MGKTRPINKNSSATEGWIANTRSGETGKQREVGGYKKNGNKMILLSTLLLHLNCKKKKKKKAVYFQAPFRGQTSQSPIHLGEENLPSLPFVTKSFGYIENKMTPGGLNDKSMFAVNGACTTLG